MKLNMINDFELSLGEIINLKVEIVGMGREYLLFEGKGWNIQ
jgi:hypothetical protein